MNNRNTGLRARPRKMRIEQDSDAVFDAAIRAGVLSEDPEDARFAGHYMYMHHGGDGTAWFKHRETRAYVTMEAQESGTARDPAGRPKTVAGPGLGLWATVALAGVFLAGAMIDLDGGPGIGTVRLEGLTAEFLAAAVQGADSPEQSAAAARAWGAALESALDTVAARHGIVLLPVEAVAAGAPDYTVEVRAAMRSSRTAAAGGPAGGSAARGSATPDRAAPGTQGAGQ